MKIAKPRKIIACILYKNQLLKLSKSAKTTRFTNLNNKCKYGTNTAITNHKKLSTNARTQISEFQESNYQNSNYICNGQQNLLSSRSSQCANVRKTFKLNVNIVRGYLSFAL